MANVAISEPRALHLRPYWASANPRESFYLAISQPELADCQTLIYRPQDGVGGLHQSLPLQFTQTWISLVRTFKILPKHQNGKRNYANRTTDW